MNNDRRVILNQGQFKQGKKYVLYWMQQSQRIHFNHALNEAIREANRTELPLVIFFNLTNQYPEANIRHYTFMIEGLKEVANISKSFGINFIVRIGQPHETIKELLNDASAVYFDMGYLKYQKQIRNEVITLIKAEYEDIHVEMIDTDLVVPVTKSSNKVEYGAYTIRPKIKKLIEAFRDFSYILPLVNQTRLPIETDDSIYDINKIIKKMNLDDSVSPSKIYHGGYIEGMKWFHQFIQEKINRYDQSNDPSKDLTSKLSMYLHFGQISSLELYERLDQLASRGQIDGASFDQFTEQLIIRRELAFNYVYYNEGYDVFNRMTEPWAYLTMSVHQEDVRDIIYEINDYTTYKTHDPYFNAAMKEMVKTGYMHNYMRMYWAKKIIEWTNTFEEAYLTIKYLNNKYFIDGRDANSFAGIAWCFGKHDRAWIERPIFGKLRYMNLKGLERKFDMKSYVEKMEILL